MTDKQIIIEKGNQKCIFYNDDICRKGDKTRDCLNCARVEYHSLYKLNWENQERLEFQLQAKEQECKWLEEEKLDRQNALTEMINILYPNADDDELFTAVFNGEYIDKLKEVVEQLKEKEQECERLKKTITNLENIRDEFSAKINQLKTENERLKKGIFKLDKTQPQVILTEGQVSLMYCTFLDMELKTTKLKQTLQEVKELAEHWSDEWLNDIDERQGFEEILRKISEVGDEI